MSLHLAITLLAWHVVPVASTLMCVAAYRANRGPAFATAALVALCMMVCGYVALLDWGPSLTSVRGLQTQVIAQKVVGVTLLAVLLYLGQEE